MEPMYLCDECFEKYKNQSAIHGREENQKSKACDECGKFESELTFPLHWVLASYEIEYYRNEKEAK